MFGLSEREKLKNLISSTAASTALMYKPDIANLYRKTIANEISQEESDTRYKFLLRDMTDQIANTVINSLNKTSPKVAMNIQLNFLSPASCGYPDMDIDMGIFGGDLYAICYNAVTGKVASREDYLEMDKVYNSILDALLDQIQSGK